MRKRGKAPRGFHWVLKEINPDTGRKYWALESNTLEHPEITRFDSSILDPETDLKIKITQSAERGGTTFLAESDPDKK